MYWTITKLEQVQNLFNGTQIDSKNDEIYFPG